MLSIQIILFVFAALYFAALTYSLISKQKPSDLLSVTEYINSINNKGGGWIVLTPLVALLALAYNFVVMSFWFIGVFLNFFAWLFRWIWNEVILAGGYFIFSIIWNYFVKWPWKLLLMSFGKILSSLKLNFLLTGTLALFFSLAIMFLGRFLQMLLEVNSWITYLFGILAIFPIGVGVSWIIQQLKGKTKFETKESTKKYAIHLFYVLFALFAILVFQSILIYLGSLTTFSSFFSTLFAGGNLLGSFLVIINSIIIIFSLGALPSFSEQYSGENKSLLTSFFKYLINNNWGRYLMAVPAMALPMIIACLLPYFLTQGISFLAGRISHGVFDARIEQLKKTQQDITTYNYSDWLDVQTISEETFKTQKANDLKRVGASFGIKNTELTKMYLNDFYNKHSSIYAAAPVGAVYLMYNKFYSAENQAVSTTPLTPLASLIDTSALNAIRSNTIPRIENNIQGLENEILKLNIDLAAVCDSSKKDFKKTDESSSPVQNVTNEKETPVRSRCDIQRDFINKQIADTKNKKDLAEKSLTRANEVALHLTEVYKLEKSNNSNSSASSKIAYLLISLWLCLLLGLAFSPAIPLFAQVNHNIFNESDDNELYVMTKLRAAASANPNQPLLGVVLFFLLLFLQPFAPFPGSKIIKGLLPSLPKFETLFNTTSYKPSNEEIQSGITDSVVQTEIAPIAPVALDTIASVDTAAASIEETVLSIDEVDEKPVYNGTSFSYNGNLHKENGAPYDSYEVVVSYIVEADGTVTNVEPKTNFGFGLEDEIYNAIMQTSGEWQPARKDGAQVRCKLENTFRFPSEN